MRRRLAIAFALIVALGGLAQSAPTGRLELQILGDLGSNAKVNAYVLTRDGALVTTVAPGKPVALAPGDYRLMMPIIGGKITKDDIKIEAGRTRTVLIDNVALMGVSVRDSDGRDPGLGVTVTATAPPHQKLATFSSGEVLAFAPGEAVDVKVDAPPQGYYWHGVALNPQRRTILKLDPSDRAELVVQPWWSNLALDKSTRIVVYRAGTQQQVAVSPPAPEHRIELEPGDYDIMVENDSGHGAASKVDKGVHLDPGAKL